MFNWVLYQAKQNDTKWHKIACTLLNLRFLISSIVKNIKNNMKQNNLKIKPDVSVIGHALFKYEFVFIFYQFAN